MKATSAIEPRSKSHHGCGWILAALVVLTFGRICGHGFSSWDDEQTLSRNPNFNPPTLGGIVHYWHAAHLSLYIPVTYSVWGGLAYLSELGARRLGTPDPWIFHTFSVLIHLGSTLIVFSLLMRLVPNKIAAMLGAAIFAVHPVQMEAVAWASGMKDLLCGFFSLLAIWQYVRFVQADRRQRWTFIFATLALIAALLSKPTAIVTPFLALVIDHWLVRRTWRRNFQSLWLWFILIIPIAIVARGVQNIEGIPLTPLWTRPLIYADAFTFYLGKIFWPLHLAVDYARTPAYAMSQPEIYWVWILPVLIAALILFTRSRWFIAGGLLFLIGWITTSGLSGFLFQYYSTVADHYLYLPMLGVAVIVAFAVGEHRILRWPVTLIVVALAGISFNYAGYWGSDITLFEHTLAVSPRSYAAHTNLAAIFLAEGQLGAAEKQLVGATEIQPEYYTAWEALAELCMKRGETERALAAERHAMAARGSLPGRSAVSFPEQLDFYGELLLKRGDSDAAIQQFNRALELNPGFEPARKHLAEARTHLRQAD